MFTAISKDKSLKSFISTVSHSAFNKLFQLHTCHGVLEKYFQTRCISEQYKYRECNQLETAEHIFKESPLHPAERDLLRKFSPELCPKNLLNTKKGLETLIMFLDSLP